MSPRSSPPFLRHHASASSSLALLLLTAAGVWSCSPAAGGDSEFWAPLPGAGGAPSGGVSSATGPGASTTSAGVTSAGSTTDGSSAASSGTGVETTSTTSSGPSPTGMPKLKVDFTTVTFHGSYSPKNVGAVWITNDQDVFVKTLEKWAVKRAKYLVKWKDASGGSTVDAVTGATRSSHGAHSLEWDGTDVNGNVVADGVYRVYVEFTEKNGAGPWTSIDFTKGSAPVEVAPADLAAFTGQHLSFTP